MQVNLKLHNHFSTSNVERGRRIELLALAWKAKVLPLYEPRTSLQNKQPLQRPRLHMNTRCDGEPTFNLSLVERDGFEPSYS